MSDLIKRLRDYQGWMKDGVHPRDGDACPSICIDDIDGDETFGAAADALERMAWDTDMDAKTIDSVCLSFDHSFGLMGDRGKEILRFTAKEWLHAWRKEF